jgi:hypothetical protein
MIGRVSSLFWFFEKIRIKEVPVLVIPETLKEPAIFMKQLLTVFRSAIGLFQFVNNL